MVGPGGQLGRHLQPGAQGYFSLRGSAEDATERYGWWNDGALCLGQL